MLRSVRIEVQFLLLLTLLLKGSSSASDGTYVVCVRYGRVDEAPSYTAPLTLVRDTVAPTAEDTSLTFSVVIDSSVSVDLTEIFSGEASYQNPISSDTEILTASLSDDSTTLTLTGIAPGDATVTITVSDVAGNVAEVTLTTPVSFPPIAFTTPPLLSGEASDGYINSAESTKTSALLVAPVTTPVGDVRYHMKRSTTVPKCDASFGAFTSSAIPTIGDFSHRG